mmetsp:Transcript_16520/g.33762  ORF Transcript_16520/g.33762 Transcript_16520/m.33762 type:complete len:448 (-) Transcript_16520:727-2070(-)
MERRRGGAGRGDKSSQPSVDSLDENVIARRFSEGAPSPQLPPASPSGARRVNSNSSHARQLPNMSAIHGLGRSRKEVGGRRTKSSEYHDDNDSSQFLTSLLIPDADRGLGSPTLEKGMGAKPRDDRARVSVKSTASERQPPVFSGDRASMLTDRRSMMKTEDMEAANDLHGRDSPPQNAISSSDRRLDMAESGDITTDMLRLPKLYVVDYDESVGWGTHIFANPHNAMRKQLLDLNTILLACISRGAMTTREEDLKIMDWWSCFRLFFTEYLSIEKDILFPMVTTDGLSYMERRETERLMQELQEMRASIAAEFLHLNEMLDGLFVTPLQKYFVTIVQSFSRFTEEMLEYFIREESDLPARIEWCHASDHMRTVEAKIFDHVMKSKAPATSIVILTQWMEPQELIEWKRRNLRGYPRKMNFNRWESEFLRSYRSIVEQFHDSVSLNV